MNPNHHDKSKKKMSNRLDTKLVNFKNVLNLTGINPNTVNYILTPKKIYIIKISLNLSLSILKEKKRQIKFKTFQN